MITADQARELSKDIVDEALEYAYSKIKDSATNKHKSTNLTSDFWVNGGYLVTQEYHNACAKLRSLGFKVEFFYEERQFVNMYTIVSW